MTNEQALVRVLDELLDQIDDGRILVRWPEDGNQEMREALAIWDYTLVRARNLVQKCKEKAA